MEDSFREADRDADDLREQLDRALNLNSAKNTMAGLSKALPALLKKLAVIRDKRKEERSVFRGQLLAFASELDAVTIQLNNFSIRAGGSPRRSKNASSAPAKKRYVRRR
jgi:hypothetical protein